MAIKTTSTEGSKKNPNKSSKFDHLIGEPSSEEMSKAIETIFDARTYLLFKQPFFGQLSLNLTCMESSEWLSTAATDGRRLYYNSKFINSLELTQVAFLIAHEIYHIIYDHVGEFSRGAGYDHQVFNIAGDFAINRDLKNNTVNGFAKPIGKFIPSGLYDPKYDDSEIWFTETIYDDLMKNASKMTLDEYLDRLIDEHMDGEGQDDGEDDGEDDGDGKKPKDGDKCSKRPGAMSESEREDLKRKMKQDIIAASQQVQPGSLPSGLERLINSLTESYIPWRDLILNQFTSLIKTDYSWECPSRRSWHMDAILPGRMPGEEIDCYVFFDMSGSIGPEDAKAMLSEVAGMMEVFDAWTLDVACFDTEVYNPEKFSSENSDLIDSYEPKGGGGTHVGACFDYLADMGAEPKTTIIFTDGYVEPDWGKSAGNGIAENLDVIWIVTGPKSNKAPFGRTAYYDEHRQ